MISGLSVPFVCFRTANTNIGQPSLSLFRRYKLPLSFNMGLSVSAVSPIISVYYMMAFWS